MNQRLTKEKYTYFFYLLETRSSAIFQNEKAAKEKYPIKRENMHDI